MRLDFKKTFFLQTFFLCALFALGGQAQAQDYAGVLAPDPNAQNSYTPRPAPSSSFQQNAGGQQIDNAMAGPADVGPAIDPDSSFSGMYANPDGGGTSLNDFISNQAGDDSSVEKRREAAIVKAAVDKQRAIQAANIARRKADEKMVQKAARAAEKVGEDDSDGDGSTNINNAGQPSDGSYYTADGGDNGDGYYGPLEGGQ